MDAADAQRTRDAATIGTLQLQLAAQAAVIRAQADTLAREGALFNQASAAAEIGLWECDLASQALRWSDGVCDLFEWPRGSVPARSETLDCYPEDARRALVAIRSEAIGRRSSFTLDTEIMGRRGRHRWIRITATVDCRNGTAVRLFGLKQDITVEKLRFDRTRHLAEVDVMTGLANRAMFQARLAELRDPGGLLLIDLDGFKRINDTQGHAVGDVCLQEAARRLCEACGEGHLVARIGGDEFAIIVAHDPDGTLCDGLGRAIVATMGAPLVHGSELLRFGASVGIARVGRSGPAEVFLRADTALYAAKAAGRGRVRWAPPAP